MKQIERIRQMEQLLDKVSATVAELSEALDKYEEVQEAIATLKAYYGSDEWKQDFADDEKGLLPSDLKRGVLSEDGLWNVLVDCWEMERRLKERGNSSEG